MIATALLVFTLGAGRAAADMVGDPLPSVTGTADALAANFDGHSGLDIMLTTQQSVDGNYGGIYYADGAGGWVMGFRFPKDDRWGCAAGDVNADGRLDAVCTIGAHHGTGEGVDELWLQQPDGSFQNEAQQWGLTDPYGRGRRALLFDHNGDGLLDLYIQNYKSRPDGRNNDNHLFINKGDRFSERITKATGELGSRCVASGDLDGDAALDLIVCGPTLHIFRNKGYGYADVDSWLNGDIDNPRDVQLRDLNADGLLDMVVVLTHSVQIRLNRGDLHPKRPFGTVRASVPLENGGRALVRDVTGDGKPDVYVTQACVNDVFKPDLVLLGRTWQEVTPDVPGEDGCGTEVIDTGKLVLFGGTVTEAAGVEVLDFPISTSAP
jgi:hypothetical protein